MKELKFKIAVIVMFVLILNIFTMGCGEQASPEERLDAYLQDIINQSSDPSPSVSVMVVDQGEVVYEKSFGYANVETLEEATPASNYRLGCLTKTFTGMCIMMLKERGLLDYDTKICDILEGFPEYGKDITIGQLMTHTSGLQDYYDYKYLINRTLDEEDQLLDADVYDIVKKLDMTNFPPGTQFNDADVEFAMLGLVVEKVSGMNFSEFMRENIFEPLQMNNTVLYDKTLDMEIPNRAYGAELDGSKFITKDQSFSSAVRGDGGVYSSLEDLYKWDQALYTDILVSEDTMKEAYTPPNALDEKHPEFDSNAGWFFGTTGDGEAEIGARGSTQGFTTAFYRIPEQKRTIIVLRNIYDRATFDMPQEISAIYGFGELKLWK